MNNLARDLTIDPELSQQLESMSHSAQCNLYAVSTPILPAKQNGAKCNHVVLNSEKMPGKANSKPVGHQHLKTEKMDPMFGRPLSMNDLRPPPNSPPPPVPKRGKYQDDLQWNISPAAGQRGSITPFEWNSSGLKILQIQWGIKHQQH